MMGWFKPSPMTLEYGEPIHQMVARAFMRRAIKVEGDILIYAKYHFVGPHGITYSGSEKLWHRDAKSTAQAVAQLCEEIQQDFNERIAAMAVSRDYARDRMQVPSLFASAA